MIYLCSWCLKAGLPGFVKEEAPYDSQVSHGICEEHGLAWQRHAKELQTRRAAEAKP